jgi:hypothetical protein
MLTFPIILPSRGFKDSPAIYKGVDGETTVVDRVMLCSDTNDKLSIKCIIRHTRRPEVWFVCSMHLIFFVFARMDIIFFFHVCILGW